MPLGKHCGKRRAFSLFPPVMLSSSSRTNCPLLAAFELRSANVSNFDMSVIIFVLYKELTLPHTINYETSYLRTKI